ncbi:MULTISPECIES: 5-methyltetrahydropteroyltriglutamate--homocysteine S-methyltransferase [Caproicibacterium]|uniref:5-methyltetrahydropteroyltriglutamate--homocysteine methyltransferase n=1 Tax=Caproicibacterium argilliputei TaxID=3030016 RepID=A0AA97D6G5_9FIRM|nr:5-methyltetrahydropteroyltriglutamate--homocysteine S-methyltransferase [Caproicibacterium argilliputei]WOC31460.1 5-methyltetrahydropteroyltriglutamate--homocysteine S-methyltransferase [Caproicibacterium argilliputei]
MLTSVIGYPRIGAERELKFALQHYWKQEISAEELAQTAADLRRTHWQTQQDAGIDLIPSNDFSYYDNLLDTAVLLNVVPERFRALGLSELDTYFAMARGFQHKQGDVHALAMKKWFNTNYHYVVPELDDNTAIRLAGSKPVDEFLEAKRAGILTKPVLIGPYTFLKLARFRTEKTAQDFAPDTANAYAELLAKLADAGAGWVQFDEPALVMDLTAADLALFTDLYRTILAKKGTAKVLLQTYFGDIRDCFTQAADLPFDGIGLDFSEGRESLALVEAHGFPADKILFAGVVNGKNIWKNHYSKTLALLKKLQPYAAQTALSTSCSLLHVPYTLKSETKLPQAKKVAFAFAQEKLAELQELALLADGTDSNAPRVLAENDALFAAERSGKNPAVRAQVAALTAADFTRKPDFAKREQIQKAEFGLPLLPTTTIGSFPQTKEVKAARARHAHGEISDTEYRTFLRQQIADCIALQEKIGLDVLVHGEYERNDMVEYFGEHLEGFLFTEKAWVQSYGSRCVKPPIIWGDVSRKAPITVEWAVYAQSLTRKPVKGMLTGPVTILNWSFPREDITHRESTLQIALAVREEVLDLEAHGIRIIQIDEAALREKLPLRKSDWHSAYLDWAVPAFRLVHSGVKPETQIHTHMCYSEFQDILADIDAMDADVISFEASRSDLSLLDALAETQFKTEVGPGVYDIHSPRVPSAEEMETALHKMLAKLDRKKLWVNPDCGLKTRGTAETLPSLTHLVQAAKAVRKELEA